MVDTAVIAELQAAGIDVTAEDAPAVVLDRLQARVVRLVSSSPQEFDRNRYERLMALWAALSAEGPKDPT